jgi:hypothetical protein
MKKINQPEVTSHIQSRASATYTNPRQPKYSVKRHQGHSGTRFARKVCKTCNNGWIERLEERIREPVTQLMQGAPLILDAGTQRDMAAWMTLVTMMVEFTDPPTLASMPSDYQHIYKLSEPPPRWKVWITRYDGGSPGSHVVCHFGMQLTELPDVRVEAHKCDTQVTTFVIGQLCCHTFCSTVLSGVEGDDYALIDIPQIWPSTGKPIDWSSARSLSDNGVILLAIALSRGIPPASAP